MSLKIIIIILVIILAAAVIAVRAVKSKSGKSAADDRQSAPMPEVNKDTLDLVNDVYDEVKREKEESLNIINRSENPPMDDILLNDIDPELFNDIDPEFLAEITSSDSDNDAEPIGHDDISSLVTVENRDEKKEKCDALPDCVRAYIENDYLIRGKSFSEKQIKDAFIAIKGNDIRLKTTIESREIEVIIKDSTINLVNPANKKYMEMSKKLLKMLGRGDDEFDFANIGVSDNMRSSQAYTFPSSVDGEECKCYEFSTDERVLRLYTSQSDEFRLMMNYDVSGELVSALKADEFIEGGAEKYITLDSLKKVGLMAFFSDMV